MPLYGLEEELYILEPDRPTLRSLYFLSRLLWSDPARYYVHSASNFSRGPDRRHGLMSGVEISTDVHDTVTELLRDLAERRADLARVAKGLLVPIGSLMDTAEPSNTCGMHLHISGVDAELGYRRVVRYLPVLALALCNAPFASGRRFGQSFRWAHSRFLGRLRTDQTYRFQDIIWSRRLKTMEVRVFDPNPDLERLKSVISCIDAILSLPPGAVPGDRGPVDETRETYNELRKVLPLWPGSTESALPQVVLQLSRELEELCGFNADLIRQTQANSTAASVDREGFLGAYRRLDEEYRRSAGVDPAHSKEIAESHYQSRERSFSLVSCALIGFLGYYIPRMPYMLWKVWQEWT